MINYVLHHLDPPFRALYHKLTNHYPTHSTNDFIDTTSDVQIELCDLLGTFFGRYNLPFIVTLGLEVYQNNDRAGLSIHRVFPDTKFDFKKSDIECVFEIQSLTWKNSDWEYQYKTILRGLDKLSSLKSHLKKVFVLIDEANAISNQKAKVIVRECTERKIALFTNNNEINYLLDYPYGFEETFYLSKESTLHEADEYLFDTYDDFLQRVKGAFTVTSVYTDKIIIKWTEYKVSFFVGNSYEYDFEIPGNDIRGDIPISVFSSKPITISAITHIFKNFVETNQYFLFSNFYQFDKPIIG